MYFDKNGLKITCFSVDEKGIIKWCASSSTEYSQKSLAFAIEILCSFIDLIRDLKGSENGR